MKKIFLSLLLSTALITTTSAEGFLDKIELGVKGYAGYSDIGPNRDGLSTGFKLGLMGGTEASFNVYNNFYLVGQLFQSRVGAQAAGKISGIHVKQNLSLRYTQLPLLVRYVHSLNRLKLFIELGTTLAKFQSARMTPTYGRAEQSELTTSRFYIESDYSFTSGIGIEFPIGDHLSVNMSGRILHSYWNILSDKKDVSGRYIYRTRSNGSYMISKNRFIGVGVGLSYKFGGNNNSSETTLDSTLLENTLTTEEESGDVDFTEEFTEDTSDEELLEGTPDESDLASEDFESVSEPEPIQTQEKPKEVSHENGFKVQILTSDKILNLTDSRLKGLPKLNRYEHHGLFKYTSGSFATYAEAREHKINVVLRKIPDAFIVRFVDGERVPIR